MPSHFGVGATVVSGNIVVSAGSSVQTLPTSVGVATETSRRDAVAASTGRSSSKRSTLAITLSIALPHSLRLSPLMHCKVSGAVGDEPTRK